MTTPQVSLILVTHNSARLLPAFLSALATTRDVTYELIVIDNASSDGTAAALAHEPAVRLFANRENIGFGRACNQGAAVARGELLMFLNPDVLVNTDWLAILVRRMQQHPQAAIIAPQTLQPAVVSVPAAANHALHSSPVRETAAVPGCAMMIRRTAWEALGGFDEQIFLYWEDTELCWRAWLAGWQVLEDLEASVLHTRGGSGGGGRWEAEATKNGLYTHLKLLPLPAALPYIMRQTLKTTIRVARGQGAELLAAWRWNWCRLGLTLAQRRELYRIARGDRAHLERLIRIHAARQRHERAPTYDSGGPGRAGPPRELSSL
jgi:hypothetical protein